MALPSLDFKAGGDLLRVDARGIERLELAYATMPTLMLHNAKKATRKALATIRRTFFTESGVKFKGRTSGRQTRKGFNAARSFIWRDNSAASNLDDVGGDFFTKSRIALRHELGGIIKARSGLLAIPIEAALKPDGTPKPQYRSPKKAIQQYGKDAFTVIPLQGGQAIIVQNVSRGRAPARGPRRERARVVFVLVKQVSLDPGRLGWAKHFNKTAAPEFERRMTAAVASTFAGTKDR